jgi:salicylate hydroxylase
MEKHALHVSIIGGGIGGLAAALQRQGIQVTVFERNPELREIGAGLTRWPMECRSCCTWVWPIR